MTSELDPRQCPFPHCGSPNVGVCYDDDEIAFVYCYVCGAQGPKHYHAATAISVWNQASLAVYSSD